MFELQVAFKYLIPRKKSLSSALISGLSSLVIALVIWLILVFLSILGGIENSWFQRVTSFHAPIRITPTEKYYQSYFYQVDKLSANSSYAVKTIGEKRSSFLSDPYSPLVDMEPPAHFPQAEITPSGEFIDPVKIAFHKLGIIKQHHQNISFQDYELSGSLLKLAIPSKGGSNVSYLSQMTYLLSICEDNPNYSSLILPPDTSEPHVSFVQGKLELPDTGNYTPILLPKSYLDHGAYTGTKGSLHFSLFGASSAQEQKINIQVVGFYDPGLFGIGAKCALVPTNITRLISSGTQTFSPDGTPTNGIFVWSPHSKKIREIKKAIEQTFDEAGISSYWKVTTFEEFEFSKDLIAQFQSDRTLFLFIGILILLVACSNIISLLTLLVNDKKKEIAILQAMGATRKSIGLIFAICGLAIGLTSCLIGTIGAFFTLKYLHPLISIFQKIQGNLPFQSAFLNANFSKELTFDAILFVLILAPVLSILAALIPAVKAMKLHPSSLLRSE